MPLQHKNFHCAEFKVLDEEQGVFSAYVSVFGLVDHAQERVMPGFFAESLANKAPKVVWGHDWLRPIGKTLVAEEHLAGDKRLPSELKEFGGLYVEAQLNLDTQDGKEAFSHLRFGSLDEFSFGYDVKERVRQKDGTSDLIKGTIYEVSPVLIGCNPATMLVGTKDQKSVYLGEYAAESMTLAALRDCYDSLFYSALYGILFDWGGNRSMDDKLTESEAALSEASGLCLRALRAMLTETGDDDAKAEAEAEYKHVFLPPAPAAGRLYEQLDAALAAVKSVTDRYERYAQTKEADGRIPSPDRREQLQAIHEATGALLAKTAPPEPLDLDLLREMSIARHRKITRAIGAQHA